MALPRPFRDTIALRLALTTLATILFMGLIGTAFTLFVVPAVYMVLSTRKLEAAPPRIS